MIGLVRWWVIRSVVLAAGLMPPPAAWSLELPAIFADHMVLQRDLPVPVWGKADPGQLVRVEFGEHALNVIVEPDGEWRADLPAMPWSADPATLIVKQGEGANLSRDSRPEVWTDTVVFEDVLVGEVWHCSGQSNMQWSVARSADAEAEIAAADYPLIRHFTVPRTARDTPQFTSGGRWQVTSPETIADFSAVAYSFGRKIHESQGVPIGLVGTSWGAASAEAFTSMPTLLADPFTATHVEQMNARSPDDEKYRLQQTPAALFHGMIHPVAPFAHRGVLWYQGETNGGGPRAVAYRELLPRMIEDWRALWGQPGELRDTPFLIVQLANFREPNAEPPAFAGWAELRDSQAHIAANTSNVFLATAIDIGDADDIHPANKRDVGLRLARLAEHHVYGDEEVIPVGPTVYSVGSKLGNDGTITLVSWTHAAGLKTSDGQPPRGFAIRLADTDQPWVWAEAEIFEESVALRHPDGLSGNFEVRYAYGINPTDGPQGVNLVNGEGLPAMPFRTDSVPEIE